MRGRRILAMMRKEVIQIRRDPRSLLIILAMPLIQLFIYGYAVNLDARHVPLCLYDQDGSQASQDLLAHFQATDYFNVVHLSGSYADVVRQMDRDACTVAVVVPSQFSESLRSTGRASVQALVDASDSNTTDAPNDGSTCTSMLAVVGGILFIVVVVQSLAKRAAPLDL
jgi:ABC-2 type transport system permease protein